MTIELAPSAAAESTESAESAGTDVLSTMVDAALELLDQDGIKAVTVRNLARRTFYSPSSIGYHVSPVQRFHTLLWERVGTDLLDDALRPDPCTESWAAEAARSLVARCTAQPRRAEFFAQHYPDPDRTASDLQVFRSLLLRIGAPTDEAGYLGRRLQLVVDLAANAPEPTRAAERVESELRDLRDRYAPFARATGISLPA